MYRPKRPPNLSAVFCCALMGNFSRDAFAGEPEEAVELICSGYVDVKALLTKTIHLNEAPDTIIDIEKNPRRLHEGRRL
ncbi:MAG: hypothetical protein VB092_09465 [Oscillospiraceae bacterium]|nr:hypothetical protein [Oscillospiraceae bacterium]